MMRPPDATVKAVELILQPFEIDFRAMLFQSLDDRSPPLEEEWLDLRQASKFAKVSPYTVRRWMGRGLIKGRKLNRARCGRILVHAQTLRKFIENQHDVGGGNNGL